MTLNHNTISFFLEIVLYFLAWQLPRNGGAVIMQNVFTLIVAPFLVGIAIVLFERWLDNQDDD